MKQKTLARKNLITKLSIFGVMLFFIFHINSYSLLYHNGGELFFQNSTPSTPLIQSFQTSNSIETYIIKGASYFLKSYSDTLNVLQIVETSTPGSIDMILLKNTLNRSIQNMTNAVIIYRNLKTTTDATPYNQTMIQKLQKFDYFGFCYTKNLNETTMWKVASYLYWGDVRGTFENTLVQYENILRLQQSVYATLDFVEFPDVEILLDLNNQFSESLMFGQYCARVFREFRQK